MIRKKIRGNYYDKVGEDDNAEDYYFDIGEDNNHTGEEDNVVEVGNNFVDFYQFDTT